MKFALEIINAISFIECIAIYSQNLLQNYIQKCSLMKRINFNSYFIVQNTSYEKSKNPIHSSIKRVLAEIIQQRHLQYKYCPTTFDADCTFGIKWCSRTLLIGRTSYSSFAVVRKWAAAAPLKDGSLDLYQMIMSSTLLFCHLLRCCPFHIFVQSFQLANVECFSNKLVFPAGTFWNCHSFFVWKRGLLGKNI